MKTKYRYKFNPYERAVGFFIIVAISGSAIIGVGVAIKKNWFEERIYFNTFVSSASNIRSGSSVLLSGLRVGKIEEIKLDKNHKIKVTFTVFKKYRDQVTEGSKVEFIRPFILGDKSLNLIQGPSDAKMLSAGDILPVQESMDILEALNGEKFKTLISRVDSILQNLDQTLIISKDIAQQVGGEKKLKSTMNNLNFASKEIKKLLPYLTANGPAASENLVKTIENLSIITSGLKEIQPEGAKKTIELLSESVITLKGMQKSFFLKSNVEKVREEMAKEEQKKEIRLPAGE